MAVTARCFLGGQGFSAHFADFVPQEKKYVAFIAACPSQHDKLSRSNEEAISLSKEDVIEIEGIVLSGLYRHFVTNRIMDGGNMENPDYILHQHDGENAD